MLLFPLYVGVRCLERAAAGDFAEQKRYEDFESFFTGSSLALYIGDINVDTIDDTPVVGPELTEVTGFCDHTVSGRL
jgi:hypothetical protein